MVDRNDGLIPDPRRWSPAYADDPLNIYYKGSPLDIWPKFERLPQKCKKCGKYVYFTEYHVKGHSGDALTGWYVKGDSGDVWVLCCDCYLKEYSD